MKNLHQGDEELQGLQEQEASILVEITRLKNEAVNCLKKDMEDFPEREIKHRFISNIDFGNSFPLDNIRKIKQRITTSMPDILSQVIACLNEESRWITGNVHGPGKSLTENPELWGCMAPLEKFISDILKEYGFPEHDVRYKMPTWFIGHTYMPAIAEKYWKLTHDLKEIRQQIKEIKKQILRDKLKKKWDSV